MTRTEDRLRTALTDAAQTMEPGTLRPLEAPSRRGRAAWAVPVMVAAALGGILFGAAKVGDVLRDKPVPAHALAGAPERLLTVRGGNAAVEDTAGHRTPVAHAAEGPYRAVAGNGRTFYLAADAGGDAYAFYRVTLDPGGAPSAPQRVPGGTLHVDSGFGKPESLAVSPDGSSLAVVGAAAGRVEAVVIDVRTGHRRVWSAPGQGPITSATWAQDNRTLGFIWGPHRNELRLLDTRGKGTDLAASRVLRTASIEIENGLADINVFAFGPDGRTLTAQVQGVKTGVHDRTWSGLVRLSATTGAPAARPPVRLPSDSFFVKPDGSGEHYLQIIDGRLGRVDGGRFSWLSAATDYDDAAW